MSGDACVKVPLNKPVKARPLFPLKDTIMTTATSHPMVHRFQEFRWSPVRKAIHEMEQDESLKFPLSDYFIARMSAERLTQAYNGEREWRCSRKGGVLKVTCTK